MISTTQNSERQLRRLGAQRQLYATAKVILGWQVLLSGPVAVILSFLVLPYPGLRGWVALWGIILAIADIVLLSPWQKRVRDAAARVQEAFDCDVLLLSWNPIKAGPMPDPEVVKEWSDAYKQREAKMPPLTDWYSPFVDELPLHIGRLACQRANCWWDSAQRKRYAMFVIGAVTVVFLILLGIAFAAGLTVEGFILRVIVPFMPALLLGARQYAEQMGAATRLDRIKQHAESVWNQALAGLSETKATDLARDLQDEIFDSRRTSPLVFDSVFKRLRPKYQEQMDFGTKEFVDQAKRELGAQSV